MPEKIYNSVAIALKDEFKMSAAEITAEFKKLSSEDKQFFQEHLEKVGYKFSEKQ